MSKQISALEDELGTELIHCTSRSLALTEAGRDFYESALRILDDFENATSRVGRGQTAPKGIIRVTVAPTFARLHMVSKLPSFFAAYPEMAVEMAASESPMTIIEDGFDLAIHSGDLPDSMLVARRFAQTMTVLVATPQYLTRHGSPESPDDLNSAVRITDAPKKENALELPEGTHARTHRIPTQFVWRRSPTGLCS